MLTFIVEGSSGGSWHLMAFMSIYSVRLLRSCGELCNSFHPSSFFRRSPSPQPVVLWFSSSSHSQILFIYLKAKSAWMFNSSNVQSAPGFRTSLLRNLSFCVFRNRMFLFLLRCYQNATIALRYCAVIGLKTAK